jgi:hypothetical protein
MKSGRGGTLALCAAAALVGTAPPERVQASTRGAVGSGAVGSEAPAPGAPRPLASSIAVPEAVAEEAPAKEEAGTSYSAEIDVNGRYVSYGIPLTAGLAVQPSLSITRRSYTLGLWGNINASRRGGASALARQWDELEVSLFKSIERGSSTIEPGAILYLFPNASSPATGELALRLSRRWGKLRAFSNHVLDVARYSGAYFGELGLSREHAFSPRAEAEARASLGFASRRFNEVNIGPRKSALNVLALDLSFTYALSDRSYLRPHLSFTRILDGELKQALEDPDILNLGVAVGTAF